MKFSDAFAHYRAGSASSEECALVEEELEKSRLISEYLDEDWTQTPPPEPAQAELRQVRHSLRRHRAVTILIAVVLAAALAAGTFFGALPLLERQYYNPEVYTYDRFCSDFDLYLMAYTELFHPGYVYDHTLVTKTGLGRYQLELVRYGFYAGESEYFSAALDRGSLTMPRSFQSSYLPCNIIERASYPVYPMEDTHKASVRQQLEELPDYIQVTAAISFPEDLSMAQLLDFMDTIDGTLCWAGIRNAPEDKQCYPLCGLDPYGSGILVEGINGFYPYFEQAGEEVTGEVLEAHFESLLQFLTDQVEFPAEAEQGWVSESYYPSVLDYIRQDGVHSYGGVIAAAPGELLRLLDEGVITQVWPMDAYIRF